MLQRSNTASIRENSRVQKTMFLAFWGIIGEYLQRRASETPTDRISNLSLREYNSGLTNVPRGKRNWERRTFLQITFDSFTGKVVDRLYNNFERVGDKINI